MKCPVKQAETKWLLSIHVFCMRRQWRKLTVMTHLGEGRWCRTFMICRGHWAWIFTATQFWRLRWARNVARLLRRKSVRDFFFCRNFGKRHLDDGGNRRDNNIKMNFDGRQLLGYKITESGSELWPMREVCC
jgi:hypothetical protein